MKKYLLVSFVFLLAVFCTKAQSFHYDTIPITNTERTGMRYYTEQTHAPEPNQEAHSKPGFDIRKIELGGSFNMAFGDYTVLNISPQVGYAFSNYFSAGAGIGYSYYRQKYSNRSNLTYNYLGLNLYGRYRPISYITLQIQPEAYYAWGSDIRSQIVPCFLVGGGFTIPAGIGGINMMFYYDVIQYKSDGYHLSPYGDRLFYSVGYVFHF